MGFDLIVGQKNGPTDWPSSKIGLLTNGPSSCPTCHQPHHQLRHHVIIHVLSTMSPATSSSLSTSLAILVAMCQTSVTFNFVTNDGLGLGCMGLSVFYDGKKTSQIALICDDFEENVIRFNLRRLIHDAARKRHGQNFMTNFQRSMTKLFRHEINGFL